MKKIYIVVVESKGKYHISQEAYSSYEAARNFVVERGDKPEQISDYCFMSNDYVYRIHDLTLN